MIEIGAFLGLELLAGFVLLCLIPRSKGKAKSQNRTYFIKLEQ
jgi:hypothetical protein